MKITTELIKKVAKIARLDLASEEVGRFTNEFKDILDYFSQINKINTVGIKPTFQLAQVKNVLRADKVKHCLTQKEALSNTKNKEDGYFKGPRAV